MSISGRDCSFEEFLLHCSETLHVPSPFLSDSEVLERSESDSSLRSVHRLHGTGHDMMVWGNPFWLNFEMKGSSGRRGRP